MRRLLTLLSCAIVCFGQPNAARAYALLAHEEAVDALWDTTIRPLLLGRFPDASEEALDRARSFAHGGSVIQDLGYYPFGNRFFSNLLHYVRSGDFVEALVHEATGIDEFAFALGALAHYATDNVGHPVATNQAVPMMFPKLREKYGDTVTYVQAPKEHVRVEFSLDVVHSAAGVYTPDAYKRFIGFRVATDLLDRAFLGTYGLHMRELFVDRDRAIATYRFAVSQVFPELTEAAWEEKREEIEKVRPAVRRETFVFTYNRGSFERDYGREYQKPPFLARCLGFLYRLLPKIGPLEALKFKAPSPDVEKLFAAGFRETTARYRDGLADVSDSRFDFDNLNFDTGRPVRRGEYALADDTYVELLEMLDKRPIDQVPQGLRQNVLAYYGASHAVSPVSKRERKHWKVVQRTLGALEATTAATAATGGPTEIPR